VSAADVRDATLLSRLGGGLSLKFLGQGSQRHRDRIVLIDDFRREPAALFCFFRGSTTAFLPCVSLGSILRPAM
jgi:hypothetical protein